jgi:hypothetical protein
MERARKPDLTEQGLACEWSTPTAVHPDTYSSKPGHRCPGPRESSIEDMGCQIEDQRKLRPPMDGKSGLVFSDVSVHEG